MLVIGMALLAFGVDPVITLTPSMADQLGGGSALVGLFASAFGVGAILAIVLFRVIRRLLSLRRTSVAGFLFVALGLACAAVAPSVAGGATSFLIAGAGFMMAAVALNTRVQGRVPDELRGRVMALWGVAMLGSRPLAAPVNGAIADHASVTVALLGAAAIVLASALLVRVRDDAKDRGEVGV